MCVKIYTDFLTKFMLKGNTRDEDKLDIALLVGAVFCWASCMFFTVLKKVMLRGLYCVHFYLVANQAKDNVKNLSL